jgi:hypothetical protein
MSIHGPTLDEAPRAIYLDVEGEADGPPAVVGMLWVSRQGQEPMFRQVVVDPTLRRLAADGLGSSSLAGQIRALIGRAERQHRVLVGWSGHELDVVRAWCPDLAPDFEAVYRDAKTPAKAWARLTGSSPAKDARKRRHRLEAYAAAVGFVRDEALGAKDMAKAIRGVRAALQDGRDPGSTPRARWERMLAHNELDCRAMRAVTLRVLEDLAAAPPAARATKKARKGAKRTRAKGKARAA